MEKKQQPYKIINGVKYTKREIAFNYLSYLSFLGFLIFLFIWFLKSGRWIIAVLELPILFITLSIPFRRLAMQDWLEQKLLDRTLKKLK